MITITVLKHQGQYRGFRSQGHAGYAEDGYDIICAAVSVLTVNAVNSIDTFTEDVIVVRQEDGYLELTFEGTCSKEASLLLDSMVLGLKDIRESYGNNYLKIAAKEV